MAVNAALVAALWALSAAAIVAAVWIGRRKPTPAPVRCRQRPRPTCVQSRYAYRASRPAVAVRCRP